MIIYNVTINIDDSVEEDWLHWMKTEHIPKVLATELFIENRIYRLIGDEKSGGTSYAVQYLCESMEKYNQYQEQYATLLQAEHTARYKDHFVAFRTLLEEVK